MVVRGEMDLASYDRFFPNQDFVPKGGFGNLIALPLQKKCRQLGNTEFVNPQDSVLRPWSDQWAFLIHVKQISPIHVDALLETIPPIAVGLGSAARGSAELRRILGLTATPYRRDGLQGIIEMQCGPIRYRMPSAKSGMTVHLIERPTNFSYHSFDLASPAIQDIFGALVKDNSRNALILEDVRQALSQKGHCLMLTHRKEHCQLLAEGLARSGVNPFILTGDLGKKERTAIIKEIQNMSSDKEFLIIATGQYLGEGFDCPQVDTLFLAFPISFKGNLVQYVGRTLRTREGKERVRIYDYVDAEVPVLKRMFGKRVKAYKSLGISVDDEEEASQKYTLPNLES